MKELFAWRKYTKGFISLFFLYYLLIITTIISVGIYTIEKNISTLENIKIYQQQLQLMSNIYPLLQCSLYNKQDELIYSNELGSIEFISDYENMVSSGNVCGLYCISLQVNFDEQYKIYNVDISE